MSARVAGGVRHRRRSGNSVTPPPMPMPCGQYSATATASGLRANASASASGSSGVLAAFAAKSGTKGHASRIARPSSAHTIVGGSSALQTAPATTAAGAGTAAGTSGAAGRLDASPSSTSSSALSQEKNPIAALQSPRLMQRANAASTGTANADSGKSEESALPQSAENRSATMRTKRKLEDLLEDEAMESKDEKSDTKMETSEQNAVSSEANADNDPGANDMSICRKKLKFDVKENDDSVQVPPSPTDVLPPEVAADREPLRCVQA